MSSFAIPWTRPCRALSEWLAHGGAAGLGVVLAAASVFAAHAQTSTSPAAGLQPQRLVIATGTRGGAYHLIGAELARQIRSVCAECAIEVRETAGGVENLRLLRDRRADIVLANASAAWEASIGIDAFKGAPVPLRALAALYPNSMHVVARRDAGVRTLADLRGKRVATGAAGSGTEVIATRMLRAAGIDPDADLRRTSASATQSVRDLAAGRLDAFVFGAAVPVPAIADAMTGGGAMLVPTADSLRGMNRIHAHIYRPGSIPAGTYETQATDIETLDVWDLLISSEDLPGAWAHEIVRLLFERRDDFIAAHANMRRLALDHQGTLTTVSLHLGAQRYLAARGLQPYARRFGAPPQDVRPRAHP